MQVSKERLPVLLQAPGAMMRSAPWGRMAVSYVQLAKGTDFTPLLKGLRDDLCQCPHWGYLLKGSLHLRFADGREEVVRAGEPWYAPPGHTAWCDEDTEFVDFSPEHEFEQVIRHVKEQMKS